jgi:DNA-binding NarL/FixJ family response regulator
MAAAATRIVIAERWSILRRGLTGVLHGPHVVVGQLGDPAELAAELGQRPVDLVVVGDARGLDVAAVAAGVRAGHPATRIAVLCDHLDGDRLRRVLQAGADAVISKQIDDAGLLDSVDRVLRGDRVIDQRYLPLLLGTRDRAEQPATGEPELLTEREHDVLVELARGASNREIAAALVVGEATVKSHLSRIYAKLDVDGRHRAVGRAVELGILT